MPPGVAQATETMLVRLLVAALRQLVLLAAPLWTEAVMVPSVLRQQLLSRPAGLLVMVLLQDLGARVVVQQAEVVASRLHSQQVLLLAATVPLRPLRIGTEAVMVAAVRQQLWERPVGLPVMLLLRDLGARVAAQQTVVVSRLDRQPVVFLAAMIPLWIGTEAVMVAAVP